MVVTVAVPGDNRKYSNCCFGVLKKLWIFFGFWARRKKAADLRHWETRSKGRFCTWRIFMKRPWRPRSCGEKWCVFLGIWMWIQMPWIWIYWVLGPDFKTPFRYCSPGVEIPWKLIAIDQYLLGKSKQSSSLHLSEFLTLPSNISKWGGHGEGRCWWSKWSNGSEVMPSFESTSSYGSEAPDEAFQCMYQLNI